MAVIKDADGRYEVNCGGTVVAAAQDDPDKASKRNHIGYVIVPEKKWYRIVAEAEDGSERSVIARGETEALPGKMAGIQVKVRFMSDVDEPTIVAEPD